MRTFNVQPANVQRQPNAISSWSRACFALRFPLRPEKAIQIHVVAPAVAVQKLAVGAFALKAELLIQRDRRGIVAKNRQLNAVQVQLAKGKIQRQPQRFGALALAAPRRLADADAQPAGLLVPQNAFQLGKPDQLAAFEQPHAKQKVVPGFLAILKPLA